MTSEGTTSIPGVPGEVGLDIRDVDEDIRVAVASEAEARDASQNDVIASALCWHYGIEFSPSGYPWSQTATGSRHWNLRLPPVLAYAIRAQARTTKGTNRGVVLRILASHYGLPTRSTRKRFRRSLTPEQTGEIRMRRRDGESISSLARFYGVKRETIKRALTGGGA